MNLNQKAFTIPEVLTVMVVTSVFVGIILFFTFNYWRYGALLESDLDTFVTRMNVGDNLRELVGTSSGLINQNSIPDSNTNNADPAYPSNLYWYPVHAIPGNTSISSGTTPLLYFRRHSTNTSGAVAMNGAQPYEDEYILYINGSTKQLLLRTLANTNVANNKLKTSCPPAIATNTCPADKVLANDLASVDMRFFSRTGNLINYTSSYDNSINSYNGPDYPVVDVMEFTVNITKKPFLQKTNATTNSTIVRIALRNT